jgi:general secretion pathway protein G
LNFEFIWNLLARRLSGGVLVYWYFAIKCIKRSIKELQRGVVMSDRLKLVKNSTLGFTLIELMVVIVILGILAGLIIPRIMGRPEEAKQLKAKMQIEALETALKLYKLDSGAYPDTEQGMQALIERPETGNVPKKWREGGYLDKGKLPRDPWGNDFVYLSPGINGEYDLSSYGADGVQGGDGKNLDISSWEID